MFRYLIRLCPTLTLLLLMNRAAATAAPPTAHMPASREEVMYQAGELDPTFGDGGVVTADFGTVGDSGHALALLPDGDIILVGSLWNGANGDIGLARFRPDGSPDLGFGLNGQVITDLNGRHDQAQAAAVQADGKIIVAGASYLQSNNEQDFAVLRYNPDGSLDPTFAAGGLALTDMGANFDTAFAVAVQEDGKIVVAGVAEHNGAGDIAVARYNPNGILDPTFSGDGRLKTDLGSSFDWAMGLALQPDGRIVVAGRTYNGSNFDIALLRYNLDGSLDATLDDDGIVITDVNNMHNHGYDVLAQSDGRIVVAGYSHFTAGNDGLFTVVRYHANGQLDATFAGDGTVLTPIGGADVGNALVQQADGKLVVVGDTWNGTDVDAALVRYLQDGSLDPAFGTGGIATTDLAGNHNGAAAAILQPDGKLLVAGYVFNGGNEDVVLARYLSDPVIFDEYFYLPLLAASDVGEQSR